jgi:toxin ParE1/3/4
MGRYVFSNQAETDLIGIYHYSVLNYRQRQADSYTDSLKKACQFLADNPGVCRKREEFTPPVRIHHHNRHLIIYTDTQDAILIVRILHDRMAIEEHLTG